MVISFELLCCTTDSEPSRTVSYAPVLRLARLALLASNHFFMNSGTRRWGRKGFSRETWCFFNLQLIGDYGVPPASRVHPAPTADLPYNSNLCD